MSASVPVLLRFELRLGHRKAPEWGSRGPNCSDRKDLEGYPGAHSQPPRSSALALALPVHSYGFESSTVSSNYSDHSEA